MEWKTSCPDWEKRIVAGESIIPCGPLFPSEAKACMRIFSELILVDVAGSPMMGNVSYDWVNDFARVIFGSYDPETRRRLIKYFFLLVSKKNTKALSLDTEVVTPNGFKTINDIRIGDKVIGDDGKETNVVDKSPIFLHHDCYRVYFSTGESVVCDGGHLWITEANKEKHIPRSKTTKEIYETLEISSGLYTINNHRTRLPSPLVLPELDLPIPPYVLGYWLGNGHNNSARVTTGIHDVDYVFERIVANGHSARITKYPQKGAAVISLGETGVPWNVSLPYRFIYAARKLNIIDNKHIPQIYLRASYKQRLELLQGLMDSDGTISKAGQASYTTITKALRDNIIELINSLGLKASSSRGYVGKIGENCYNKAWSVQFWPFDDIKVFTIPRKVARQRKSTARNSPRSSTRQISNVEKIDSVPVQCIMVDNDSKQFLITKSLIPTHNSTLAAGIMLTVLLRNWRNSAEFIILAPTIEIANNSFYPARDMVGADDELSTILHVQPHFRTITHRRTKATLKIIAAESESVGGKKATGVLVDELWLLGKKANAENMLREATGGLASRPEGFVIYLSTQSDAPPTGVFEQQLVEFRKIRDGTIVDEQSLPVIYEFPPSMIKDGSYRKPVNWYITNPNLNASVDVDYIVRQGQKAERNGEASYRGFAAKHLNVEIGIGLHFDGWAGADIWGKAVDRSVTFESILIRCDVVTIGIDGGGLDDLLGIAVIGRERITRRWLVWTHAFISPEGEERRKINETVYNNFKQDGDLTLVDKLPDDLIEIGNIVRQVKESGLLYCVGVDAIGIGGIVDTMDEIGITEESGMLRSVRQGISLMGAIKTVERKLADGTLIHGGQRMMNWCVGNAKVVYTATAMRLARDETGAGKIDPLAAVFDAAELMMSNPSPKDKRTQLMFFGSKSKSTQPSV